MLDSYVQIHYPGVKKALLTTSAAFTGSINRLNTSGFIQVQLPTCLSSFVLTLSLGTCWLMLLSCMVSMHGLPTYYNNLLGP